MAPTIPGLKFKPFNQYLAGLATNPTPAPADIRVPYERNGEVWVASGDELAEAAIPTLDDRYLIGKAEDGGLHISFPSTLRAVNHFQPQGGIAGSGPVLAIVSDIDAANVDANYAAIGAGGHHFGNGSGELFAMTDYVGTLYPTTMFSVRPGDWATNFPRLSSSDNGEYFVPAAKEHRFMVGEGTMMVLGHVGATPPENYLLIKGSIGSDHVRTYAESGINSNVSRFESAKGTGVHYFANASGTILTVDSGGSSSSRVNSLVIRNNVAGSSPQIRAIGTDTGIQLVPTGTGIVSVTGPFALRPGSSVTPPVNGDVTFELTANTTLTLKAKGSDGTVRSVALTLA